MDSQQFRVACSNCSLRELCLPVGLSMQELEQLDDTVATRRRIKRGEALFRAGEAFESLYPIRSGFFKTRILTEDGREQVSGFQMAGEILGMDGISAERHACEAIALEDSEVCVVPFAEIERLSRRFESLQRGMHRILSREIVRDQGVMLLLGNMRAEERLAAFLLNLSQRLQQRGFSPREFVLRMTREEIGSYLGLKLETVSRTLSRFQQEGMIEVQQRNIRLVDEDALRALVNTGCPGEL